jgi:hypothetical protein
VTEAQRDRWGRYLITPPDGAKPTGYTRVTTVAKTLDDGGGLLPWKATATIVGALRRPGLHARWQALLAEHPDPWYGGDDAKSLCKKLVEECAEAGGSSDRADVGTALHSLTELYDRGQLDPATLLESARNDLQAYAATMAAAGITVDPDFVECLVILDEHKVAGTVDRIVKLADGRWVIADVKTGTDLRYSWRSIAVQLAAYANADALYEQEGHKRYPMPNVDKTVGIVMHLPAGEGRCTLYEVDLVAGWRAFNASMWTRNWRKDDTLAKPLTTPEPVRVPGLLAPSTTPPPIEEGADIDAVTVGALGRRYRALNDDATAAVSRVTREAAEAGASISLAARPSVRRFEIGRALVTFAEAGWSDEIVRALVGSVLEDQAVEQPGIPLGAAIGALTIDQAKSLADLASRYAASELVAAIRDDGTLYFTGLAA